MHDKSPSGQHSFGMPDAVKRARDHFQHGRLAEAERLCRDILREQADGFDVLHLLGAIKLQQRSYREGVDLLTMALRANPGSSAALSNLAYGLVELGLYEQAATSCDRALAIESDLAGTLNNLGLSMAGVGRYDAALSSYDKAIATNPVLVEAMLNRGDMLDQCGRYYQALASFEKALAIAPGAAETLNKCGLALARLGRYEAAIDRYSQALKIRFNYVEVRYNRAVALEGLGRYEEALRGYESALAIDAAFVDAEFARGKLLERLDCPKQAIESFIATLTSNPVHPHALSALAHCKLSVCDWNNFQDLSQALAFHVAEAKAIISPLTFLCHGATPGQQLLCARQFVADPVGIPAPVYHEGQRGNHRIRVAYLAADLRHNPIIELLERHDRSRFEVVGFSFEGNRPNSASSRVEDAVDQLHDVKDKTDQQVARLVRELEIDIAVDLNGYGENSRCCTILARRPAPIQVNYLGYPGTTGAPFIDYLLVDRIALPLAEHHFFSEKIVTIPGCHRVIDSKRSPGPANLTRGEVGLPEGAVVFGFFDRCYKISPPMFEIWMRLLRSIGGSVLWLAQTSDVGTANVRAEAAARGIDPNRLVFGPPFGPGSRSDRYRLADLFLDTLPYNAQAAAGDALLAGLPVLTCTGNSLAGRIGTSLLHSAGLPELVTNNLEEYCAMTLRLANDPALLGLLRRKLMEHGATCALFNTDRTRRNIEAAYTRMFEAWQHGQAPQSFVIDPT